MLLVDPDTQRAPALAKALAAGGAEVSVATSASFALTMLEWNKQDVIVSRARLGDMDGAELCAILRSDPSTKDVRFVLVAGTGEVTAAQTATAGIDLVLPDALTGSAVVTRVVQLVRMQMEATGAATPAVATGRAPVTVAAPPAAAVAPPPPRPAAPPPRPVAPAAPAAPVVPAVVPPAPPAVVVAPAATAKPAENPPAVAPTMAALDSVGTNGGARTFQGALGVLEIEELTQAIAIGGKTGRLMLVLAVGGGQIVFESGRVTHAEFAAQTGEIAFGALVAAAHRERGGKFCFIPAHPAELRNQPKTIDRGVDQLLLGVVTAMDEETRA
ncbi:MAG TPA: DUF4388 domain-containing protein [Methylomirabilota bacterium]|jgi:CheY-like chemotaxis protein|nr:DUF4388 domain-containing protein [Methylomirabilota bacterium]